MNPALGWLLTICGFAVTTAISASLRAAENGLPDEPAVIKEIALVHFSHTDIGFTDSPSVCRELYRRYLDLAVDTIEDSMRLPEDKRFFWTAEATVPVNDWWQVAPAERRAQFLKAVRAGQLDIAALACNNTPFMNAGQWQTMVHWLPDELWNEIRPAVAVQNDVNGLPRAAALALLDRGIHYLFTGINEDSGGVPFPRPSAFWWKMPDGRRLFVWLNIGYGSGFDFFESGEWRRGPVPAAADTRYRPPRAGDFLRSDENSVRTAHRLCLGRIRQLEKAGYPHELLTISLTSQWRYDNDPPFAPIADFVSTWNRLRLEPRLRFTTVSDAMRRMEKIMGASAPEHAGEWTDWWANGSASAPREIAASRQAKRFLGAAQSPLWDPLPPRGALTLDRIYRDLCLFDEHTWGSSLSVAQPYSLETQGQFVEKSILAYRPMAQAEWLLSQRLRSKLVGQDEGLFLANPYASASSGWVRMITTCLRDSYQSVEDPDSGLRYKIYFEPGIQPWGRPQQPSDLSPEDLSATFPDRAPNQMAKFWVENIKPLSIQRLRLSTTPAEADPIPSNQSPQVITDDQGWPTSAQWPSMKQPLFLKGFGGFKAIQVQGFAPRHILADIRGRRGEAREKMRQEFLREVAAAGQDKTAFQETPHTLLYTQSFQHPRLQAASRRLEVWKREPRARLTLRFNRLSSAAPEIFYVTFPLPTGKTLPRISNGGQPFIPFQDQLPGTCRDYFAIDGWADYHTADGRWLWVSRDAPLVAFGSNPTLALLQDTPQDLDGLMAMIFNNFWYTNFVADEHGLMEFQFDLVWLAGSKAPAHDLAASLAASPLVLLNPALPENPRVIQDLYEP